MQNQDKPLLLGDEVPNFTAETSTGQIEFHKWLGQSWAILFSHPADFTPVCTTELGRVSKLMPEFEKKGVKVIALSCNDADTHKEWIKDVDHYSSCKVNYPIIADADRNISKKFGMLQTEAPTDAKGLPMTVRSVYIIGPDRKLKLTITYPASCGRNFDEILRVVDSLQLTHNKQLATPVDWKQGQDCIIAPTVSKQDADKDYKGYKTHQLPSGKEYLRTVNPKDVTK